MGKKKRSRRAKKNPVDCETSEEEKQLENLGNGCQHASKAVNISNLRKILKDITLGSCQQCDSPNKKNSENCDSVWMCLYCGNQGCGRNSEGKHALLHYETPHSDTHALALCLDDLIIWCYDCDCDIQSGGNKKIAECVELIKKNISGVSPLGKLETENILNNGNIENPSVIENCDDNKKRISESINNAKNESITKISLKPNGDRIENRDSLKIDRGPKFKGLINLGNTCFLNSVLQSLVQTNILYDILSSRECPGITAEIGNSHKDNENSSFNGPETNAVPMLEITLSEAGPLSRSFCSFVREYSNKSKTINPGQVLGQICRRAPQFRGALQQDSHELLRHLLDGLKSEEIKRYQAGILRAYNLLEKVNPKTVDDKVKSVVKAYGRCIPNTLVDDIFGGQLISTVLCDECGMSSQVFEPFLDLSLPVTEEKVNRPGAGKKLAGDFDYKVMSDNKHADKPSKHQEKKAKKQAKRNAKLQKNRVKQDKRTFSNKSENNAVVSDDEEEHSDDNKGNQSKESLESNGKEDAETSDADVEDNAETGSTCSTTCTKESAPAIVSGKELPNDEESWNFGNTNNESSTTVAINTDELCDQISAVVIDDEKSAILVNGLKENSLDIEDKVENDDSEDDIEISIDNGNPDQMHKPESKGKTRWMSKSVTTLASRYQPASQECSVYSCLNQFTAPELLTGPNKFGCENCTRLKQERDSLSSRDSDEKEGQKSSTVYTNASKQLLIFSPPAILTLHLKRFQQVGYSLRKVNRHVEFPLILDLAPFSSSMCLGLPTLEKFQHEVLYYLYAIVEHSGRLTGGHYTAYVRGNPKDEKLHSFLNRKPVVQADIKKLIDEMQSKLCSCEDTKHCETNNNSYSLPDEINSSIWYHISDSFISEVSESTVLRCQAYLLFYRRIV
ncbi:Ubiquitin carboxyl-terminal hydrolase 16 [Chamberlinius hualienensis]